MRACRILRVAASLGFVLVPFGTTPAQAPDACRGARPPTAVTYRERGDGGTTRDTGRVLSTTGGASYGVDVDSRIDVAVDVNCLRRALASRALTPEDARRINAASGRLDKLSAAAAQIDRVVRLFSEAQAAHADAARSRDFREADQRIRSFIEALDSVLTSLEGAIEARLMEERRGRSIDAQAEVGAIMAPIFDGPGYDFPAIRNALTREVDAAEAELRALPDPALAIEIQAHLVKARGEAVPIALPRYNAAATGPDTRFGRLQFGVTQEQALLHARYDSMARSLKSAQSLGGALVNALQIEWQSARPGVDRLLVGIRASVAQGGASLDRLGRWTDETVRTRWLASVKTDIERHPKAKLVAAQWNGMATMLGALKEDADALKKLAALPATLTGGSAEGVRDGILAALATVPKLDAWERASGRMLQPAGWRARADTLKAFLKAVQDLAADQELARAARTRLTAADGPIGDLRAVAVAADQVRETLEAAADNARLWLARAIAGDVARTAASLPVPADQRRVSLSDDASTSMNLRTIPVPRDEGDIVRVSYEFYAGDRRLQDGWHDDLRLRAFGLLGRAVAGLAFARPEGDGQWSPTASLSWIATYRRWPKAGSTGLGSNVRAIGLGLSTMSLNFEPDERVQIGLAGTLSMIDDRILVGWGHNLQAKSRPNFWFFSLRLFSTSGSLGGN